MRLFRRLIALLLMVTLPAFAWAALGLPDACPMQSMSMEAMAEAGHDCCDPAAAQTDDGSGQTDHDHGCKPGQECKTGSLYEPQFPRTAQPPPAASAVAPSAESLILSRTPTGVWRPPRFL